MRLRPPSLLLLALAVALALPAPASAIPAFARRYRVSCTACHQPFPRLKPFGEAFAGRGFALEPGAEPPRAVLDVGDDLLELPREFPISLRFDAFGVGQNESPRVDFETPWIFKLLAGGRIADKIGFFAYYILEAGNPGIIEDAWVQFTDVFGLPANLVVGQFQISDSIIKRELRLQRLDYEILTARVGASVVDLTYDRGVAVASRLGPADLVATVTNGNGIGPSNPFYDSDRYKSFSLNAGMDVGPVRVAGFGYYGREGRDGAVNRTWYLGPQLFASVGERVQLAAVYLERSDSNPFLVPGGPRDLATRGGFGEAVFYPSGADGRLAVLALYNRVHSDDAAATAESAALAASWLVKRNVRLMVEVQRDFEHDGTNGSLGTALAF